MSRFTSILKKPVFIFVAILTIALIAEFLILEGFLGISFPSDRGSAVSSYEIQEKGTNVHFVTRNRRFSIVDRFTQHGSVRSALVLRESFVTDRQDGIEGDRSTVRVDAFDGQTAKWSFQEAGETGQALDFMVYEVTKFGCCDAPNTYTYFSLRDGAKLRTTDSKLSPNELAAIEKPLVDW